MLRLFRLAPAGLAVLTLSEALLLVCAFLLACFFILEVDPTVFLLSGGWARLLAAAASILLALHFLNLYTGRKVSSRLILALELAQGFGFGFLVQALLAYVNREWVLPRSVMITGSALGLSALLAWRTFYEAMVAWGLGAERVLFVGATPLIQELAVCLGRRPELGMVNLGYLDDQRQPGTILNGAKVLGPPEALRKIAARTQPDRIVVGLRQLRRLPLMDLLELRFSGVRIEEIASTYEAVNGRVCLRELRPAELMFSGNRDPRPGYLALQTGGSMMIALGGALLLLPVMLLAALVVKLSLGGPVLERQLRVGRHGHPFTLYRFRSPSAELLSRPQAGRDGPLLKLAWRWWRRLRLDALPQLFSVLKGDMSLVGPRPHRPEFAKVLAETLPGYQQRHSVKPGLTGWCQINARTDEAVKDALLELEYDLYYIKYCSLALDAYILLESLKRLLGLSSAGQADAEDCHPDAPN